MRRGIRFPQWWMLLVAILAILSGQGSLVGMERFAKRHRQTLNELLGTDFGKSPSGSTFWLLLAQLDVAGFETLLRDWMASQPGVAERLDNLVCDGKTLRGSIAKTASGAAMFIAQVSLYSQTLGVAIAHTAQLAMSAARFRRCASCWRLWSWRVCWCKRMCCMPTALFPLPRPARRRLPDCRQTQPPQMVSADQRPADIAADLVQRACLRERYRRPSGFGSHQCQQQPLILHADNGNAMRGATLESRLEEMGVLRSFSRPRVSNDNPYSESLFRTVKYRPDYPSRPFAS